MTAAEADAILQSDPEWVRQDAERRAQHEAMVARLQREMEPEHAPLLAELAAAGVRVRMNPRMQLTLAPECRPGDTRLPVQSIDDLVNTRDSYPEAVPILIRHLRTVRHPVMIDCVARALTVREARKTEAARVIVEKLKQMPPSPEKYDDIGEARWALANALTVVADASIREELEALVADPRFEDVRDRLEVALRKVAGKKRRSKPGR